jgi:hypothetical protein
LGFDIRVGGLYTHYRDKSKLYKVLHLGFLEENETPCVVYQNTDTGIVWVRATSSWLEMVKLKDNQVIPRFEQVK